MLGLGKSLDVSVLKFSLHFLKGFSCHLYPLEVLSPIYLSCKSQSGMQDLLLNGEPDGNTSFKGFYLNVSAD